jgi:hypothetical protein
MSSETVQYDIIDDHYSSQCFDVPIVTLAIKERTCSLNYVTIAKTLTDALQNLNVNCIICKHRLRDISVIHGLEETGFMLMGVGAKLRCVKNQAPINARANHAVKVEPYENAHLDLVTSMDSGGRSRPMQQEFPCAARRQNRWIYYLYGGTRRSETGLNLGR